MNLRKKIISLLLIFTLMLIQFVPMVHAETDTIPPNIISISSNNTNIKVGDTVTFDIEIEDNFSGASILFVQWRLKTDNTKTISKQFDNINNIENFNYTIPENTYAGEWQAVYISLSDYANNHKFYYRDDTNKELLSKLDFEVEDTNQDNEPPVVSNVRILTQNFSAPGEVVIQYDITDEKSGVKSNYGGVSFSPIYNLTNYIGSAVEKVSENTYQSTFRVESKYEKYIFRYIQVSDNAGNWKNYTYEDLGLTNELDIIPSNYEEDITPPKISSIEYNKTILNIPDYLNVTFDIEENESGMSGFIGRAYFKSENGDFEKELVISTAINSNGITIENKGSVRLDLEQSETYTGEIYLYKIILEDILGNSATYSIENGDFEKQKINIKKIKKEYTLETSTAKNNYIDEIRELPEGSTVLCNVVINNQVIEKELFDAIKGKDINITFMSIYNGSSNVTSTGGSISTSDTNTGIQWIVNGKDIVNETKDIDMSIRFTRKQYSKYIIPEYEINGNLEIDFWNNIDFDNTTDEELKEKGQELIEIQKKEIKKYFDALKQAGYVGVDEAYNNTIEKAEYQYGADCKSSIVYANEYSEYLSIEFADNGLLPCKTLIRIKPEYAMRALFGAKDLKLYYADGDDYSLVEKNINIDEEEYYNFNITHNSEYCLTNGNIEKLAKSNNVSDNQTSNTTTTEETNKLDHTVNTGTAESSSANPKTGDTITIWISLMIISILGIVGTLKYSNKSKQ